MPVAGLLVGMGVCVRVCVGAGGLAGPEEIPIQFLHKANDSPPRSRGTPPPHLRTTTGRGPVYFYRYIIYFIIIPFLFFFSNWNDHHPLAGVTKRRVLETHLPQTIDQGH